MDASTSTRKKFIDLEQIIRSKNPRLLKLMPAFLLNYIRRVIHEKDVNAFIDRHGHKYDFDFVHAIIEEFGAKVEHRGLENIPEKGGFILASNHPLGGLDAMALLHAISARRTDVRFIVNDILLQLENLKGLFTGVNKHGRNSARMLDEIEELYSSGKGTLIFPAGLVSRKQHGLIRDLEWKKSFITRARKHQKNVVPVYIEGQNTQRFYNLALWRKRLGIKANLEMFFLVDEMYRQKNKTITIIFGEQLPYQIFDKRFTDQQWADKVKEHVYALASDHKARLAV
ncbi:MAG: 1-acyl-sn-glycerol-3-phosphate acyltransferase [Bacteroidota bacterium]